DPQEALDGQAVAEFVEERREVVRTRNERDPLHPGSVLGVLLDPGVQVTDDRLAADHDLPVQLQKETEHAVGRRMLRAHVDDHRLLAGLAGSKIVKVGLLTAQAIPRSSTGGTRAPWNRS